MHLLNFDLVKLLLVLLYSYVQDFNLSVLGSAHCASIRPFEACHTLESSLVKSLVFTGIQTVCASRKLRSQDRRCEASASSHWTCLSWLDWLLLLLRMRKGKENRPSNVLKRRVQEPKIEHMRACTLHVPDVFLRKEARVTGEQRCPVG